jgi:3-hydroxyisobutyryl-CoA hydrolase
MRSPTNEKVEALLNTFQSKKIPDFSLFPYLDEINQTFGQKTLDDLIVQLENSGTEFARKQLDTIQKMVSYFIRDKLLFYFRIQSR